MPEQPVVQIQIDNQPGAAMPVMATPGSAGYDLCACAHAVLAPGKHAMVPTGLRISMPAGLEAQIRPRSGLAAKHAVTVLNSPGTIDSDYRGEVCVILINHGDKDFVVEPGMRIAQMVFSRVTEVCLQSAQKLDVSDRGEGGFGSTGIR
ncbi:MAG: dUTP diphosphatase [Candidatus Riflebacteria bacterium]|nr:dUTP diphosphatase [Candidatus Riflebacteria bacterium]